MKEEKSPSHKLIYGYSSKYLQRQERRIMAGLSALGILFVGAVIMVIYFFEHYK